MNERLSDYTLPAGTLPQSYAFRLVSLARADTVKSNAIPTEATAVLAVSADDAIPLLKSFEEWFNALQILYGASEQNMRIELTRIDGTPPAEDPLTAAATDNLLCFLRLVPQGVIGLIPGYDPPVVETSSNFYDVILSSAAMTANTFSPQGAGPCRSRRSRKGRGEGNGGGTPPRVAALRSRIGEPDSLRERGPAPRAPSSVTTPAAALALPSAALTAHRTFPAAALVPILPHGALLAPAPIRLPEGLPLRVMARA